MQHTILIVEDHDGLRQLLGTFFSRFYSVVGAKDGLEAMTWLHRGISPSAIITDLQMPELDGIEFIHNLRNSGLYRKIPLIVITGELDNESEQQCKQLGVFSFVQKPFNPLTLQEQLEQLLSEVSNQTAMPAVR